jgi:hypothetical protein
MQSNEEIKSTWISLKGTGTRNDFDQLHGNARLTGLIVLEGKFVENFSGVLRGVLHSVHSGGLLAGGVLEKSVVERGGDVEVIVVVLGDVEVRLGHVINAESGEVLEETLFGHQLEGLDLEGDRVLELVVENHDRLVIVGGVLDKVGDARDVLFIRRKSSGAW